MALVGDTPEADREALYASTQRPITALAPFVPKVVLSSVRVNGARYCALDEVDGLHGLAAASRNMQPSMVDRPAAIMVADVKGFTQLTELLSKQGRYLACRNRVGTQHVETGRHRYSAAY